MVTPDGFDWAHPDYANIYATRIRRIENIRAEPAIRSGLVLFYKEHPVEFINDWGCTFDPRNAEIGLPTTMPFLLFPRQVEYIEWLLARWRSREDGVVEKSRDMGVSWLCVAFAVWMWRFYSGVVVGFGSRKEEYVDKLGDPKSLFWKVRQFIELLPNELQPRGWNPGRDAPHMRIVNPENGSAIVGEAGDNIGRGNRTSIYFKDESAHYERPESIDAALSQTSNCKIDVSTPNGSGNPFYQKAHGGRIKKFVFDWRDDPRKGLAWYARQKETLDPIIVAQEIDRDYEASVSNAFISSEIVAAAVQRGPADVGARGGLRVGIDVARFGNDKTAICFRRGRVLLKTILLSKLDTVDVAGRSRSEISAYGEPPEQIAVDTIGIGAGVADMLRGWFPDRTDRSTGRSRPIVVDVNSSLRMDNGLDYNLRAMMWREMREWLKGGSIPNDPELRSQLTSLQYGYRGGELLLESKEDARKRGVKSPDIADGLALTFAYPTIVQNPVAKPANVHFQPSVPGTGM